MAASAPTVAAMTGARELQDAVLGWYDRHRRDLPWRSPPGAVPDPYHVWLSEIMLQQTTVATVGPYYKGFLARWPTVAALAAAPLDNVLAAWAGLGYYARARNLHRCAQVVVEDHGGRFPADEDALRALPGIGVYTAAAIAAIAFERPTVPVDGNIERVVARLNAVETPLPGAKPELRRLAATLATDRRPGDFAQALMDLGATICTPRRPACALCPLSGACAGRRAGIAETLPRKAPKKARPHRHGVVFWAVRPDGRVLLRRRPARGLLGGMMEIPSTDWRGSPWSHDEACTRAPVSADWRAMNGTVRHVFTHFSLDLSVVSGAVAGDDPAGVPAGIWVPPSEFGGLALPSVMRKVVALVLTDGAA